MRSLRLLLIAVFLMLPVFALAQYDETGWPVVDVGSPAPSQTIINTGDTVTWYSGTVIHLQGFVFVDSGTTLLIQPGTIVKGDPGQADNATSLIISPGAQIIAQGTPRLPIVFTTYLDNVGDTSDIPDIASSKGLWGGLVIEGRSFTCSAGGEAEIEGVPAVSGHPRLNSYGGGLEPDCNDNSGILQYVSLRYAGSILAPNVEINAVSLGAVGDGTTIDHVDTYYASDDDFECFGGNVNLLYTAIIYGDDDGWDTDECWSGIKQFGFMLKDPRWGDRITENDGRQQAAWTDSTSMASTEVPSGWGCDYPSYALSANLTCIAQGHDFDGTEGNRTLMRENYRAYWYNNVFMEQPKTALEIDCPGGDGNIDVEPSSTRNLPSGAASIAAGHPLLDLVGNFWWQSYNLPSGTGSQYSHFIATGGASAPLATARVQGDLFPGVDTTITGKNHIMDPELTDYETVNPPTRHEAIDPRPASGSPLIGNATAVPAYAQPNGAYVATTYAGAFAPDEPMWCQQPWCTAYDYKIIPHLPPDVCGSHEGKPVKELGTPAPSQTIIDEDIVLSADTIWHLEGFVFIDSGYTLYVEPGTVIKGDPGQAENATSLIISPGARIIAPGTKDDPIIMTTWLDDVDDPNDIPDIASSKGLWGGLVIEGRSFTCSAGGESEIEGVPAVSGHPRLNSYGGGLEPDCNDNSGILQYVSLRYAGSILAPNVEINAVSLGAVGDGTTIDHIETYYASDDDFECFGGNVNLLYTAIIYGDDDGWDTDECWSGIKQFGFMLKDPRWGDRITENDGRQQAAWTDSTSMASTEVPSGWGCDYPSYALSANLTCIAQGHDFDGTEGNRTLMRENYRAYWYNNVFMEQPKTALEIDCPGGDGNIDVEPSSTRNLPSGAASIAAGHPLLDLVGNFWWQSYNLPSGTGSQYSHFIATGGASAPLATARVQSDLFPGVDTTITGKNHIMNPEISSYTTANPPVRAGVINPVPAVGSPLIGNAAAVPAYAQPNGAYVATTYVGAFDPNVPLTESWIWGWTVASECYDILGTNPISNYVCGDANGDGNVNLLDILFLIAYKYDTPTGPAPTPIEAGDANGDGSVNLLDILYLIAYKYDTPPGPAPICP